MQLGHRSWPPAVGAILAPAEDDAALSDKVQALRAEGEAVIQQLPGQAGSVAETGCERVLRWNGSEWTVESLTGQ
jgi:ATP phosphoribosyltransferase regulatory subunit